MACMEHLKQKLEEAAIPYSCGEPLARHTSFQIGGPAALFCTPHTAQQLVQAIGLCREEGVRTYILGNGSNLLFSDHGFDGVVVSTRSLEPKIRVEGDRIIAGAGVSLKQVCEEAACYSLTGLEFAYGIPGSLGGAVYMNAGAYGGETRDVLLEVEFLDEAGQIRSLPVSQLELGYRTSIFARTGWCVLRATLQLHPGDSVQIQQKMDDLMNRRRQKQPLEYPSAGSAFKRPEGAFAGSLIEQCGLRGFRVGDAAISEKHCGFIVNLGHASCADVLELARQVSERVQRETGFVLEKEIRVVE
mgnify:FL=1